MGESTLSTSLDELRIAIAHSLGMSMTAADWTDTDKTLIDMILKKGLRQFYFPPQLSPNEPPHSWNFLKPIATITTEDGTGNYDLPDDFGGIEGNLTYEPSENKPDVLRIGEGKIRNLRADTAKSFPLFAAIRPKEHTITTTGQRFEVRFWPIPNGEYVLSYQKLILPSMLVDTTITYPYGGAMHAETIEASCLAAAELQEDEIKGAKWQNFLDRLTASIRYDKTAYTQTFFGYNGDKSDGNDNSRRHKGIFRVTYQGGA